MKLDLVKLSHTDIWPLKETVKNHVFKINLVTHVGFQK